jgi:hypothetical protein
MKKALFVFVAVLASLNVLSQTEEIEKQYLHSKILNKEIDPVTYQNLGREWNKLLSDFNGYPKLPYNEEKGIIEFIIISNFPDIKKNIIYNRIKEWAALSFGSLNEALHYDNYETGKIVLKGFVKIPYKKDFKYGFFLQKAGESIESIQCNQTFVFTIMDNKVKVEIFNLSYKYELQPMIIGSTYYQGFSYNKSIHLLYPITSGDPITWKEKLSLLKETDYEINLTIRDLEDYIKKHKEDYIF